MIRKTLNLALISTVYNEGKTIDKWIEAVGRLTVLPEEFIIVDGGSTDDTVTRLLEGFARQNFVTPQVIIQRCNIAQGRNLAVRNCTHDIIVSLDAGSAPVPEWLEEISRPFQDHPDVGVVGGKSVTILVNDFQKKIDRYIVFPDPEPGGDCSPSSRNIAFTRQAWAAVGGYPEWLTLTAEDALYNANLHHARIRCYHQPTAIVGWEPRPDQRSYLRMMWNYGYGAAEAGFATKLHLSWLIATLCPPLILFSRNPISYIPIRYLRNAYGSLGWVAGKLWGKKPPPYWKRVDGVWMSPEAVATAEAKRA